MNEFTDDELLEKALEQQVGSLDVTTKTTETVQPEPAHVVNTSTETPVQEPKASDYIGHKIHDPKESIFASDKTLARDKGLSRLGEKIGSTADIRDGWIDVDREMLGDRSKFYPEDWRFRIKPATVEAIRNWSTLDEENALSIDDVFNEILKSCVSIITDAGPLPWGNIRSWDRFFFILLVREYTFAKGEKKIEYTEECINCDNDVTFTLSSTTLMYDMPDPEVIHYFDEETMTWNIDPQEFDLEDEDMITLYLPTLEKEANIKAWMIARIQENRNRKIDSVFMKFLPWMTPKISKDDTIAKKQIRQLELKYKSWDEEMFSFMNEIIKNVAVTPSTKLITTCPTCGEEVTSQIRFQDGISALFDVPNRHKKFGTK